MVNLRSKWNELREWLMINLILPFAIPYLFVFMLRFAVKLNINNDECCIISIFNTLLTNGVYQFLGLTLFLSVFQDYKVAKTIFTPIIFTLFFIHLMIIGFMFISSLAIIDPQVAMQFEDNIGISLITTLSCIIIAVYIKLKIITQTRINNFF